MQSARWIGARNRERTNEIRKEEQTSADETRGKGRLKSSRFWLRERGSVIAIAHFRRGVVCLVCKAHAYVSERKRETGEGGREGEGWYDTR